MNLYVPVQVYLCRFLVNPSCCSFPSSVQPIAVHPGQSQQYVIKPKYYHTHTTHTQTHIQPQPERPIPLAVGHNPIQGEYFMKSGGVGNSQNMMSRSIDFPVKLFIYFIKDKIFRLADAINRVEN